MEKSISSTCGRESFTKTGTIDCALSREEDGPKQNAEGKRAITHYRVERDGIFSPFRRKQNSCF